MKLFLDMHRVGVTAILIAHVFLFSDANFAQDRSAKNEGHPYQLHEWGVFTVPRDADWLKQDMLTEWQSFPSFFHGTLPKRSLAYRGPVTKPVIFFHGQDEFYIDLFIHFSEGQPLIWWPPAQFPANGSFGDRLPDKFKDIHRDSYLHYALTLNKGGGNRSPVEKEHWVNRLRNVKSAPVFIYGSHSRLGVEQITEDFIYYDGLMKPPTPPTLERTSDGIKIETKSNFPWLDMIVIERSYDGATIKTALLDKIDSGSSSIQLKMQEIDDVQLNEIVEQFTQRLVKSGLHQDEAQSLIDVWRVGLFERPGITVIHRIPQEVYNKWIPLHLDPAPEKMVRVGLVVHQNLEPEIDEEIERLIGQLGSNQYKVREQAELTLHSIGGAAIKSIKAAAKSDDPEIADRANRLLKQVDVDQLLDQVMKRYQDSSGNQKK